ncbi:MAG TPA: ferredoxin [Acidimicrobiales bacterium]|nr:ferredoxin [Acidimicrobiales bacterium]
MKVRIDPELCSGHGRCYSLAPDVYGADDEGYGAVLAAEVPAGLEEQARQGARNCPERAITIEE